MLTASHDRVDDSIARIAAELLRLARAGAPVSARVAS